MSTDAEAPSGSHTFTALEDAGKDFPSLRGAEAAESLDKWNVAPTMVAKVFRFGEPFAPEAAGAFLSDFFGSEAVQTAAPVSTAPGTWGPLGALGAGAVKYARLPTTVLRLDFFDRLRDAGVVRAGDVAKCLDVQCGDVLVSDRLRRLLLDETCEDWDLFSAAERDELIFHVMRRLAVGGGMCQYEDRVAPYLDLTKALYKDLVTVQKTAAGVLQVGSLTFAVSDVAGASASLFPRPGDNNFCYVVVDPVARHVKLWYHAWYPMM